MQAVILAAGRGTRLRPVTEDRSKAMAPVLGRPLVARVVETLAAAGIRDCIMVVGPDDPEIRAFFGDPPDLDISTRFVVQSERSGMAHALALAAPWIDGTFVLSACDSLKPAEHVKALLAAASRADGALSLMDVAWDKVSLSAPVEMEGNVIRRIVEKPTPKEAPSNTVSLPLYVLPPILLEVLADQQVSDRGEYELQSGIQAVIDRGARIVGVRTFSRRQVSTPEDLLDLNLRFLDESSGGRAPESVPDGTVVQGSVWIDDGVGIGLNCRIGPDVVLERGSVLGDEVHITRSMVLRHAVVPEGLKIEGQVIVAE